METGNEIMIKEAYVGFEVAKLLKEKGFNEKGVKVWYDESGEMYYDRREIKYQIKIENHEKFFQCPTLQMAMAWLREVHNIFIEIGTSIDLNGKYHFSYTVLDKECKYVRRGYTDFDWDYEDAVEASLKFCLKNLI